MGAQLFIKAQVALLVNEYGVQNTPSPNLAPQAATAACNPLVQLL